MIARKTNQRGVALLTVLLLTATVAVLAVGMTDILTRAMSRAGASEARDQAFWALYGLESAAIGFLEDQAEVIDLPGAPLFQEPAVLAFGDATATLTFADQSNCFNVNDLVDSGEDGGYVKDEAALERFASLIVALGGSQGGGEQLGGRIIDFIDTNRRAEPGGAEDYDYSRRAVPYRTSGQLLAAESELRTISGFSRDVYRSLAPFLCVLPTESTQVLNVNSLTPEQAPLLLAITDDALTLAQAERLITDRPPQGYADVPEFMQQPALQGLDLPSDVSTFLSVETGLLSMDIVLESTIGRLRQEMLLQRDGASIGVIERRVGERLP
ncbi:MAG: type II secretion system minor pseudopilin GspK [Pseudomonadota bacterium]